MHSCLYRGQIQHRRKTPAHKFRYATSWAYLDLAEVDELISTNWCLGQRRFSPAAFRRADHFGDPSLSMTDSVHQMIHQKTGLTLDGPVRLLTQLRHFGIYFSPINMFYCFDHDENLSALVAEVSNTPWNERHCYVLWDGNRKSTTSSCYSHPKEFHVSPFMGMDSVYQWRIQSPSDQLRLSLGCDRNGDRIFQAHLHLNRVALTSGQLLRSLVRRPVAAAHIVGAIYYQALRLWIKRCQFFPHPNRSPKSTSATTSPVTTRLAEPTLGEDC